MEEARIDKELQGSGISNISVAQKATFAEKPINPTKTMTAAAILLLAAGGTFGIIFFRESLNPPVLGAQEATRPRMRRRQAGRGTAAKSNGHPKSGALSSSAD
jgi:hypothetical protein